MKKILTGIKATGQGMHIGNYFGAFKPIIDLSKGNKTFMFLPDFHSLTSVHNGEILRKNKKRILREFFSLIPNDSEIIIFEQSKIKKINNITRVLSSLTPYSLMLRAHSFKDSQNKNSDINMATFNYPILMTADIISYDIDIVPIGKDQKQHLEFARDIAGYFNKTYNTNLFKLPQAHIEEKMMTIPGIDGKKMSKSYNNFIGIFDDKKDIKSKIMSINTDNIPLESSKNPDNCNVFSLIKLFASSEREKSIRQKYLKGGYGYGDAKLELLDIFLDYFKTAREKYFTLENNMSEIYDKLEKGNRIANEIVDKKYSELAKIIGIS